MVPVYFLFFVSLILIRAFAGYDSRFQKGRYITLNSPVVRAILTVRMSFYEKTDRLKKDIPKMSVCGVIFYAAAFIVLIINIVFLIIPQIPIQPWVVETGRVFISVSSLNKKVSAFSVFVLFFSLIIYTTTVIFRIVKKVTPKWLRVFLYIITVIMFLCASAGFLYFLTELIFSFSQIK